MKLTVKQLSRAAVIAAFYAALCFFLKPLSFGSIQLRVSETLCVLPIFIPEAILGLFIGCVIANLLGGALLIDVILGSITTFTAAVLTRFISKRTDNIYLSLFPPVILNALIVGAYVPFIYSDISQVNPVPIVLFSMLTVGIGQAVVIYLLGIPFSRALKRISF
ncbi:MAG: QueT transporter family protein [Clostridia bacterium]|nr:QueT transporter family protein [Clostridia bacterium]